MTIATFASGQCRNHAPISSAAAIRCWKASHAAIGRLARDWIGITETANGAALTGGALTSVWAGCWDDGTRKTGITAIYPEGVPAGIDVSRVGTSETKDEEIYRLKWYTNMAIFNRRAIARLPSINQS